MFNLVEMCASEDEQKPAPCKFGNTVESHACYCHNKSPDAPRKCHVWRNDMEWNKTSCELFEAVSVPHEPSKTD
jgi:hypothetical protein